MIYNSWMYPGSRYSPNFFDYLQGKADPIVMVSQAIEFLWLLGLHNIWKRLGLWPNHPWVAIEAVFLYTKSEKKEELPYYWRPQKSYDLQIYVWTLLWWYSSDFLGPHSSHFLQPLGVSVFGSIINPYHREVNGLDVIDNFTPVDNGMFMRCHHHISEIGRTLRNIIVG